MRKFAWMRLHQQHLFAGRLNTELTQELLHCNLKLKVIFTACLLLGKNVTLIRITIINNHCIIKQFQKIHVNQRKIKVKVKVDDGLMDV